MPAPLISTVMGFVLVQASSPRSIIWFLLNDAIRSG
jgi:hypothetical protein